MKHGDTEWFQSDNGQMFIKYLDGWHPVMDVNNFKVNGESLMMYPDVEYRVKEAKRQLNIWLEEQQ